MHEPLEESALLGRCRPPRELEGLVRFEPLAAAAEGQPALVLADDGAIVASRDVDDPDRLEAVLQQIGPALLIIDLRARESRELLDQVQKEWPQIVITALGILRSEPLRDAEQSGIYAAEDLQLDRRRFQALITRAFDYLRVLEENRDLREESALVPTSRAGPRAEIQPKGYSSPSLPMLRFPRVFRPLETVEALLTNLVEGVADAAGVTRVGIFSRNRPGDQYHLRAGLRCLPETHQLEFAERDSLVRWFERHAHLVSRSNLAETPDRTQRSVLRRALDSFGAEVIVPLYGRGRILGWLFFGHRLTGQRFEQRDLEGLMILAEHVSTVLENALLYEEVTLQKTLAETLLKTIPPGIVAIDENGTVRWFNPTAEQILGVPVAKVLNKPVEIVGITLAGFLRDTLDTQENLPARQWVDPNTRRSLSIETRRLADQRIGVAGLGENAGDRRFE